MTEQRGACLRLPWPGDEMRLPAGMRSLSLPPIGKVLKSVLNEERVAGGGGRGIERNKSKPVVNERTLSVMGITQ